MLDVKEVVKRLRELRGNMERINQGYFYNALSDAISFIEREEIVPVVDIDEAKCPICKCVLTRQELLGEDVLYEDFFGFCPDCGRKVIWEGKKNDKGNA